MKIQTVSGWESARGGQATRAARAEPRRPWTPKSLGLPKQSVDRLLDELREDR
jgi:hypothetical protein